MHSCISITKPNSEREQVCFRKIADIVVESFKEDIKSTNLFQNYTKCDLDTLVRVYDSDLRSVLDKHAPLVKRTRSLPKREPWYTDQIHSIRRTVRAKERRFRKSRSDVDRAHFQRARNDYRSMCRESKVTYYNDLISKSASDRGQVFKIANRIMKRENNNPLPEHTSSTSLANQFGYYFTDKINRIRSEFDSRDDPFQHDSAFTGTPLSHFEPLSLQDTIKIVSNAAPKSCELDPIPSSIVKQCKDL